MINDNLIESYFAEIKNYLINKENQIKFSLVRNQCSEIAAEYIEKGF